MKKMRRIYLRDQQIFITNWKWEKSGGKKLNWLISQSLINNKERINQR